MTKEELIEALRNVMNHGHDTEAWHMRADDLLLQYINDPDIEEAFHDIEKRYA